VNGRYVLSPRAQRDIDDIWDYTAERWGPSQAEFYIRQIWRHIETVAALPSSGHACDDIRKGYYRSLVGSHVLFYRVIDGGIDVVRVLHGRMDVERHF
jgi:toxin ParE1/3/4